jgi:hypothetical protein
MSATPYHPPTRLGWIKRRARRLQKFYGISRKLAVYDARLDFFQFKGGLHAVN